MFLPFIAYFLSAHAFIALVLMKKSNPMSTIEQWQIFMVGAVTLCFWSYQVYLEVVQFINGTLTCRNMAEHAKGYCTQFYNFNDILHLSLTVTFISNGFQEGDTIINLS